MIELELAKFMYSYVGRLLPVPLLNFYQSNDQWHDYDTRGKRDASTPRHKTSIFNKSYLVKGPALWSKLTYEVKKSVSVASLVRKVKKGKLNDYWAYVWLFVFFFFFLIFPIFVLYLCVLWANILDYHDSVSSMTNHLAFYQNCFKNSFTSTNHFYSTPILLSYLLGSWRSPL